MGCGDNGPSILNHQHSTVGMASNPGRFITEEPLCTLLHSHGEKFKKYCCKLVVGTIYTPYTYLKELRNNKPLKKIIRSNH
jgi:hypothetical protein